MSYEAALQYIGIDPSYEYWHTADPRSGDWGGFNSIFVKKFVNWLAALEISVRASWRDDIICMELNPVVTFDVPNWSSGVNRQRRIKHTRANVLKRMTQIARGRDELNVVIQTLPQPIAEEIGPEINHADRAARAVKKLLCG